MSDVLFSTEPANKGEVGFITLNRLKALNALTFEMIRAIRAQLIQWQDDVSIKAVVVQSNSEKAFCAGGDVVKLHDGSPNDIQSAMAFFKEEYLLNCLIRAYNKPYVCLLNGLTIGGGVGISLHGSYPIATENFTFAMPETGIGFFPDVGGGYLLTRCTGVFGVYLGLTGKRIGVADSIACGLISHTLPSDKQAEFLHALLKADLSANVDKTMEQLLAYDATVDKSSSEIMAHKESINQVFRSDSVESIFEKLDALATPWALKTLSILQKKSPTALKVTLEQLKRVKGLSMEDTMAIEYVMSAQFMKNKDFCEGVRALLVDKDAKPNWQANQLSDVSDDSVYSYFEDKSGMYQLF